MKKNTYISNTLLAILLGLALLVGVLVRTFAPNVIVFPLDLPNMVLFSLVALLIGFYGNREAKPNLIFAGILAALTFGILPVAACFAGPAQAIQTGILGGVVFLAVAWMFDTMMDRLSTGPAAKAAPFVSALGLYLASQCLMGLI